MSSGSRKQEAARRRRRRSQCREEGAGGALGERGESSEGREDKDRSKRRQTLFPHKYPVPGRERLPGPLKPRIQGL